MKDFPISLDQTFYSKLIRKLHFVKHTENTLCTSTKVSMLCERVYAVCTFLKAKFVTKQSAMNKIFKSFTSHATFVAIKRKHVEVCPISCLHAHCHLLVYWEWQFLLQKCVVSTIKIIACINILCVYTIINNISHFHTQLLIKISYLTHILLHVPQY